VRRDLQQSKDLELGLVRLRWLLVAFGVVQTLIETAAARPRPYAVPLAALLTAGLLLGNVLVGRVARRARRTAELRWVGILAFALDIVVVLGFVWIAAEAPSDPAWVIAYLLPIEGAARFGMLGAFIPLPLLLVSEFARELSLSAAFPRYAFSWSAVANRVGMGAVIALVAGMFADSLRREADRAAERTVLAERAAHLAEESAKRETEARRDLAAFHTAILAGVAAEDPGEGMQAITEAVGRELECDALGVLLLESIDGGDKQLVAAGVYGDPGYARGTRFVGGSEPLGAGPEFARPSRQEDPAEAVVPLRAGGGVIGILHERADEPGSIDRERLLMLGRLADQVSLVVQAARMRARQEEMLVRLRELDEMKSDFVAITSHELRTPLTAVRGFVDALRRRLDELSAEEIQEYLSIIHVQTDRLIRLVEDLLLISRIEAGKLTLVPEAVETSGLLASVRQGIGEGADRIAVVEETGMPASLVVDGQRLAQILTNLLVNALKFSPPDARVELRAGSRSPGTVTFAVRDGGSGIAPEEINVIFERFHQSEASAGHSEGAGLGLYIARHLAEAMGGRIAVESNPGEGATFSVTMPTSRTLEVPAPLSGAGRAG
jgi:signal transduction histidine kinase